MSSDKKLIRLQKEMKDLKNLEMKTRGALQTLCKALAKEIDQPGLAIAEIDAAVTAHVTQLKAEVKKATQMFNAKMTKIEEMTEGWNE